MCPERVPRGRQMFRTLTNDMFAVSHRRGIPWTAKSSRSTDWLIAVFVVVALLATLLISAPVDAAPAYPVRVGPTGRYLVDQNGVPFLITGESPQAMIG